MRDEIMRLADDSRRAEELAVRLVAAGPKASHVSASETNEISEWIIDAAPVLRTLARTHHVEDKLGMVPAEANEWAFEDKKHMRGDYAAAAGWNACRDAMLAASPAPDHSAGVGGVVFADVLRIPRAASLDPIIVYFEDSAPGQGRVTIACYGDAWTAAWGAMGDRTVRQFVAESDSYYLTGALLETRGANRGMRDYTGRIAAAVIAALAQPADAESIGMTAAIVGEVVEIGDDEAGQPRILIHTSREAIKAHAGSLLFQAVTVTKCANAPKEQSNG